MQHKAEKVNITYSAAGVDIDAASSAKELIKKHAGLTMRPEVLSEIGFFGGLFRLEGYREPVLVSSVDGVGTKLKIASVLGRHDTVGIDLVNHCVNDILTCGAEPLFFLDYIAMGKLLPEKVESVARGLSSACQAVGCALIGGETAEMPGLYSGDDYDLAGFIVGVVEKDAVVNGNLIQAGDAILGLPSSGPHTNGYSLIRKVLGTRSATLNVFYQEFGQTLGEELLEPHRCYYSQLKPVMPLIKGIAHITGGGLPGNIPRVLPQGLAAQVRREAWTPPAIFSLIQRRGNVEWQEMYRVFNMGVGIVLFSSPDAAAKLTRAIPDALVMGEVIRQRDEKRVMIE